MTPAFRSILLQIEQQHVEELGALEKELQALKASSNETASAPPIDMEVLVQYSCHDQAPISDGSEIQGNCRDMSPYQSGTTPLDPNTGLATEAGTEAEIHKISELAIEENHLNRSVSNLMEEHHSKAYYKLMRLAAAHGWVQPEPPVSRTTLHHVVRHDIFDGFCAVAILANTALLGVSTDYSVRHSGAGDLPIYLHAAERFFTCWFLVELVLRWIVEGFCEFLTFSPSRWWNWFDILVVGTDVIETVLDIFSGGSDDAAIQNLVVMRTLRVLRIARALRVVKLVNFCKDLRLMVLSMMKCGASLLWSSVLLSMTIYVFGIFLMQSVAQSVSEGDMPIALRNDLMHWFGSLPKTYYTLFLSVTGGVSWVEICDPLIKIHWINGLVMSFYIFFTVMAMLNIITGIFVESARESVSNDSDEVIHEELAAENSTLKQLYQIFHEADLEGKGMLNASQFEAMLNEDRSRALMARMGLQINGARGMFDLLDHKRLGFISIEELLVGCMRMRGGAKSVDMASLMHENSKLRNEVHDLLSFVKFEFLRLESRLPQSSTTMEEQKPAGASLLKDPAAVKIEEPATQTAAVDAPAAEAPAVDAPATEVKNEEKAADSVVEAPAAEVTAEEQEAAVEAPVTELKAEEAEKAEKAAKPALPHDENSGEAGIRRI